MLFKIKTIFKFIGHFIVTNNITILKKSVKYLITQDKL